MRIYFNFMTSFIKKLWFLIDKIQNGVYHQKDVDRIRANNDWIKAFNKHSMGDFDKAVNMIDEVLIWRKEFGANDLLVPGKLPFNESMLSLGALYMRNKEKNGRPLC